VRARRDPLQFAKQVAGALVAVVRIFRQTRGDDPIDGRRSKRLKRRNARRLVFEDRAEQARARLAFKRGAAGQHLEQQRAEGEDVGTRVGFEPFDLFRRHVLEGPEDRPLRSQIGRRRRLHGEAARRDDGRGALGEAEVEQLGARFAQHDVRGLEIAMDDARPMRAIERIADTDRDLQRLRRQERTRARETFRHSLTVEIFENQEADRVTCSSWGLGSGGYGRFADVVQRADVRMIQRRDRARFTVEAVAQLRIGRERRWQNFDRDRAIEPRVARPIHFAHPARANERDDFVDTKLRSCWQSHAVKRLCS
jgi:hypothetical protein